MARRRRFAIVLLATLAPLAALGQQDTPTVVAGIEAYNGGDVTTAFRLLAKAAAAGDSDAQVNLGYLYARGQGTPPDQLEALRLYRLSAEQGNAEGMNAIGFKSLTGSGVPVDLA